MSSFWRRICSRITRALKLHGTWQSSSFLTCWGFWRALVSCVAGCPLGWVCLVSSRGQLGLMCSGETYPEAKWPSHCLMSHAHMWAPSYLTVCDPTGCSPRGSSVHGGFQATILEWLAISSSRALPNSGIKPGSLVSPAVAGRFFTAEPPGKASYRIWYTLATRLRSSEVHLGYSGFWCVLPP